MYYCKLDDTVRFLGECSKQNLCSKSVPGLFILNRVSIIFFVLTLLLYSIMQFSKVKHKQMVTYLHESTRIYFCSYLNIMLIVDWVTYLCTYPQSLKENVHLFFRLL